MIDLTESARITPFHKYVRLPIMRVIATAFMFVIGTFKVTGRYRIPRTGGVLVLANHLSDMDPMIVQLACPRPIHFMGKIELFEMPIIGKIIQGFGGFPVRRGEPDRAPLKLATQLIKEGEVVAVFPEGELSESGELLELKAGVALIARLTSGYPVICCGIKNPQYALPYGQVIPRPAFKRIEAHWGEVKLFSKEDSNADILAWVTAELKSLTADEKE